MPACTSRILEGRSGAQGVLLFLTRDTTGLQSCAVAARQKTLFLAMSTRRAAARAASPPLPPPLPRQARRRPPASSTSPRSSSCEHSLAAAPSTSLASRPSPSSSTPRSRPRASACGRKSAASSCRRSQRARAAPCGGCAIRRCCVSPTRRRGRRQAFGTASSSTARGGSRRADPERFTKMTRKTRRRNFQAFSATARA